MVTPRLPFLHPNFIRVAQSYKDLPAAPFDFLSAVALAFTPVSILVYNTINKCIHSTTAHMPSQASIHAGDRRTLDEVTLSGEGDQSSSERNNILPDQQLEDAKRVTTITFFSTSFDKQAFLDSKQGNSLLNSEQQEEHAMGNDGAQDTSTSSARLVRTESKKPHISPCPNQGALSDPPPGLIIPHNKPPRPIPIRSEYQPDTYFVVRDLTNGGFTNEQSVTITKAIQHILQKNIDIAKQCLISKSTVDNEPYQFKAACSELQHASRIQLEQEYDTLSQRLTKEIADMKDNIKGMLTDYSIATREDQRNIDTLLQELDYKISVSLNSDGKTAVDSIRWMLTRRAALTIASCALMIVFFLKYSSTRAQDSEHNIKNE
ncbi:hypothetical protein N7509_000280 [Penicillium cosmopolitanum]|uniref:Uncharacterized protein n=1 Tax=Penicillium cosmopolitanum TaxID=1131564 RepID=A0A9W9WA91_9EURO|nr:uncharacterized protein N7509_000280 [Penicillium cosmopolitanum]KAJ5413653.1 hypothetical protein N7509_000280 [Penicillium cosmopolitanum]